MWDRTPAEDFGIRYHVFTGKASTVLLEMVSFWPAILQMHSYSAPQRSPSVTNVATVVLTRTVAMSTCILVNYIGLLEKRGIVTEVVLDNEA